MSWSRPVADYASEVRLGVVMYGGVSLAVYINGVASEIFNLTCATPAEGAQLGTTGEPETRPVYRMLSWLAGSSLLRERFLAYLDSVRATDEAGGVNESGGSDSAGLSALSMTDLTSSWDSFMSLEETVELTRTRLPVRFVVDVISGTSAGGLNGLCLAKAVANGEDFGALAGLWLEEADLTSLLNDDRSFEGLRVQSRKGETPTSLLNSDRLYEKLIAVLRGMTRLPARGGRDPAVSPLSAGVDLSITTTDIEGVPVPLRLFDKLVYERRHRIRFRFRSRPGQAAGSGDFGDANLPFMAFAGRSTSSFPVAFEPMRLADVSRLESLQTEELRQWDRHFDNFPAHKVAKGDHVGRSLGDGGYLDNKPFSYVVQALSEVEAARPGRRQLIYVEPSPKHVDPEAPPAERPDAIENSMAALMSIPRYETIREDLNTVIARNRMIERIDHLVRLGEADISDHPIPFDRIESRNGAVPDWNSLGLSEMISYYGTSFLPYRRLRVYAVTDELARHLVSTWGLDEESDQFQAVRAIVRAWRDTHYSEEATAGVKTQNAFLGEFDTAYRYRRLGFLGRRTGELIDALHVLADRASAGVPAQHSGVPEPENGLLSRFEKTVGLDRRASADIGTALQILRLIYREITTARQALIRASRQSPVVDGQEAGPVRKQAVALADYLLGKAADPSAESTVTGSNRDRMASLALALIKQGGVMGREENENFSKPVGRVESDISSMAYRRVVAESDRNRVHRLLGSPKLESDKSAPDSKKVSLNLGAAKTVDGDSVKEGLLNSGPGDRIRRFLADYYVRFDSYDQMGFPLQHRSVSGDAATVDLVRISPPDATALIDETDRSSGRTKLAGTALANFGAFLDRRWRKNDLMWGRLDGAERLVHSTLTGQDDASKRLREMLTAAAHEAVLHESFGSDGRASLIRAFTEATAEMPAVGDDSAKDPLVALRSLLKRLKITDEASQNQLAAVLSSFMNRKSLAAYLKDDYDKPPLPDREKAFGHLARGVSVFGRLLDGISERHRTVPGVAGMSAWIARLGIVLQGFVAVSLPGSLRQKWAASVFQTLYFIEGFIFIAAMLFGLPDLVSLAVTAIAVTAGSQLVTLLMSDAMRSGPPVSRSRPFRIFMGIAAALLLLVLATGISSMVHDGVFGIVCDFVACEEE